MYLYIYMCVWIFNMSNKMNQQLKTLAAQAWKYKFNLYNLYDMEDKNRLHKIVVWSPHT